MVIPHSKSIIQNPKFHSFRHLELTAFQDPAIFVFELKDINTSEEVVEVHVVARRNLADLMHFLTHHIVNLESVGVVVSFGEIKINI